ncbi:DUF2924 domain-containing protein [Brevundimonas sp.]|uniref:DUF2924 domain-containing protein n=1 Tax=Brevundimonas sp. TaxID=1871086 RepID=UPI003D0F4717
MSEIKALIATLEGQRIDALRSIWCEQFEEGPPPLRSANVLRYLLAERLQLRAHGSNHDLDRRLSKTASRHRPGYKPTVRTAAFKPGSRLEREWKGERHQVDVVDGGYVWNGQTFASLSPIARQITGSRWNGPRFFGLREEAA